MICWSVPALIVYIYYVKYLSHYMFFLYICRSVFSKSRVFVCVCIYNMKAAHYSTVVRTLQECWKSIAGKQSMVTW